MICSPFTNIGCLSVLKTLLNLIEQKHGTNLDKIYVVMVNNLFASLFEKAIQFVLIPTLIDTIIVLREQL